MACARLPPGPLRPALRCRKGASVRDPEPNRHDAIRHRAAGVVFFRPGLLALEGGMVLRGPLRGAAVAGRGRPHLHDRRDRLGRDPDRSLLRRPDRRPHPPDGRATIGSTRPSSSRTGSMPAAWWSPASSRRRPGPGLSLEELLIEAGIPALEGIDTRRRHPRAAARRRAAGRHPRAEADDGRCRQLRDAAAGEQPAWEAVDHVAAVSTATRTPSLPTGPPRGGRSSSTTA